MKKIIVIVFAFFIVLFVINTSVTEEIVIPSESIRVRIIANSNSNVDQELKSKVKDSVQSKLNILLKDTNNIEQVREILTNNLDDIKYTVKQEVKDINFEVDFGYNYFPEKKYKGINYSEGYYESLVVSLGKSEGNNWWCVLFPPLCLIDESEKDMETVEYKSFVKELIDKYF